MKKNGNFKKIRQGDRAWDIEVIEPKFPFGSLAFVMDKTESVIDGMMRTAKETNFAPVLGGYFLRSPMLLVQDPELAKTIMVKDFGSFHDRTSPGLVKKMSMAPNKVDQILVHQMTMASGETWKNLRTTFSPIFTSGKMKAMMAFMNETGKRMVLEMEKMATQGVIIILTFLIVQDTLSIT